MPAHTISAGEAGRIGPNAVTRVAEALEALRGRQTRERVFAAAGLVHHLHRPPERMVPDDDVAVLHAALAGELGEVEAQRIGAEAGRLTARYLLANRIPRPAQLLLGLLPGRLALSLLLRAIRGHAWTFAGAGAFSHSVGREITLTIKGGPVSRFIVSDEPACAYYAATFQTLFRAIISPDIEVVETACEAQGAEACVFAVRFAQARG